MDEKIEAVARALCKADGRDPDQGTGMEGGDVGFHSFAGRTDSERVPLWRAYAKEAERFVVAAEALQPFIGRVDIGRW